ncbi:MAG TPA: formate dehydrogenase subunit gamma [Steroidobacteraceae bacterium]|nr:formate dehydrogenase subunit gamma [Steroidobacteraceae bacterium]
MSDSRPDAGSAEEREAAEARRRDLILRYDAFSRSRHWLIAMAFVLAALSGLALFHPALFGLSGLFGGGPWTRILHPFFGLLMVVPFLFLAAAAAEHNRMQPSDWAWLRQYRDVVSNREDRLPEVGIYNAGQKLVFYVSLVCLVGLLLTGLPIWRAYFSSYFPIGLIRLASVVHSVCALALICTIIVHIYAAIWVKGSIRAMTRGWVTPGWAWKHHRAWYREVTKRIQQR